VRSRIMTPTYKIMKLSSERDLSANSTLVGYPSEASHLPARSRFQLNESHSKIQSRIEKVWINLLLIVIDSWIKDKWS